MLNPKGDSVMTQTNNRLVGNSFKLGYRFQRYWDTSMALAFFAAEVGTGLFLVSFYFDLLPGMILGLAISATLKPYFHLAHMGVPGKSWRAILRPDRSWVSRGALAIGVLVGFGALHVVDRAIGLPAALGAPVAYLAVAGALVVMCYQGMAMSDSESLTLWASPLVPVAGFCYSLTAGVLATLAIGWEALGGESRAMLSTAALALLLVDLAVVVGLLVHVKGKSKGGAFSVELLTSGEYAGKFRHLVLLLGFVVPAVLLAVAGSVREVAALALLAMLVGFLAFRLLMFKAAVFEPISHDLAGSIGLPSAR
jgi:DMSO reductase anchor subunit